MFAADREYGNNGGYGEVMVVGLERFIALPIRFRQKRSLIDLGCMVGHWFAPGWLVAANTPFMWPGRWRPITANNCHDGEN